MDATGQRFGKLTALFPSNTPGKWQFRCDCGKETTAFIANARRGLTKSCGCGRYGTEIKSKRFGRLFAQNYENGFWICLCDCGNITHVTATSLRTGGTKSCGCLKKELVILRFTTHGMRKIPEYRVWANMRNRCSNPNNHSFPLYGGRGVKVCDRWKDFINFYTDMGPRLSPKHSIERLDNNADYAPKNCIWATPKQQANNRRTSRKNKK